MSDKNQAGLTTRRRWSPVAEVDPFERFDLFGRPFGSLLDEFFGERGRAAGRGFAPAMDVAESDNEYIVSAELPGSTKDDITVELHEDVLTIRGEKRSERSSEKEHARYVERRYGTFSRSLTLPANADGDRLEASFRDGVLTLRIPKREEVKPRTISVKS